MDWIKIRGKAGVKGSVPLKKEDATIRGSIDSLTANLVEINKDLDKPSEPMGENPITMENLSGKK